MTSKTPLPATIRETFERYGIIKPPTVPPLDKLLEAAAEREMKVELNAGPTVSQAVITAPNHDDDFTQVADSPELAVAAALAMALKATIPFQVSLFGDDEPEPDPPSAGLVALSEFALFSPLDESATPEEATAIVHDLRDAGHNVEWDAEAGTVVDCDTGILWEPDLMEQEITRIRATAGAR